MPEPENRFDATRAELFEALGHPIRVKILQSLEAKPMGFAELKKEVGIESSGHLEFHLRKLSGLVGSTPDGFYTLTDDGREAIRVLKSVPTNHAEAVSGARVSIFRWNQWSKPLVAILLVALIALTGVAIYQQEQIATLNQSLSSAFTTIGGTGYYYENVEPSLNGSAILFHGVTFTFLPIPLGSSYSNPSNYTFRGSVLLTNGTLLNLSGKTVMIEFANVSIWFDAFVGVSLAFPDGYQTFHPLLNATAKYEARYDFINGAGVGPAYWLTYSSLSSLANPWFTQHINTRAGLLFNFSPTYGTAWTLYVNDSS